MKNFIRIPLGRCLNEYQHPLYSELIKTCSGFLITNEEDGPSISGPLDTPKCGTNQYCYGVLKDSGFKILLRYIVDSSD